MTANYRNKTILVVEDEMDMRFFLATLLETSGFTFQMAVDGRDGLRKAESLKPALIILDVMMPEQGGFLMYERLKNHPELKKIPVIILSAVERTAFSHSLAMFNSRTRDPLPPPNAYVEKPPDAQSVLHTIRQLI